jgi:hypothetical protein
MHALLGTTVKQAGGAFSVVTGTAAVNSDPNRSTTETNSHNLPAPGSPRVPRAQRKVHVAPPDSP